MEAIAKSIREKIGKLVAEENIDFHKLRMLVRFLEDIKISSLISVKEMPRNITHGQGVEGGFGFAMPPRNELSMMTDELSESLHALRTCAPRANPIGLYISWYEFMDKISDPIVVEAKTKLQEIIIKSINEEVKNMSNQSKEKESMVKAPASTERIIQEASPL